MKKLLILLLLSQFTFAQFTSNKTEYFTVSTSIDPTSSFKEKGIDIVGEIEYVGFIYVKAGFESFSVLQGGYKDAHWGIGYNLKFHDDVRIYSGLRTACVFRDGSHAINYGAETGFDYNFNQNLFIGLRATLDKRYDQKVIFNWNPELKFSGFVRIGYKWDFKG